MDTITMNQMETLELKNTIPEKKKNHWIGLTTIGHHKRKDQEHEVYPK